MSNTKAGGRKYRQTMIAKHGSLEAWRKAQREMGAKGGRNGTTGGFAYLKDIGRDDLIREAGRKGGRRSRKAKATSEGGEE